MKFVIDNTKCANCDLCIDSCPVFAIERRTNIIIDETRCIGCRMCVLVCKSNAIKIR
ncbi:4Fe-4S binding protein [Helicovermis profundi]|uniref:4Fe-4S binding protein n=1 Tax=Helicovermis profundi TaxID=3065157 RepID=A0AAU9EWV4_9FIRM|nr:4Fe-4S binding protein [Clostridia bacterium S502]